jgi:protein-L-isoaspartate(D-aspartate) O-methyltransferase
VSVDSAVEEKSPEQLRTDLVTQLLAKSWIRTPAVEAAFRAVPRHRFVPDAVTAAEAYQDTIVATKRGPDGKSMSTVSAPYLQAYMLEEAMLGPGSRVLEVGSGGYNAALAAEVVGPYGHVVTVDIDADITANARAYLDRAGYPHVQVVHGDGELGYEPGGPFDAIIVTVEAGDISPHLVRQLAPGGRIVVPLRLRTLTRCLTLTRTGDHLTATAALQCGFVPMQGDRRQLARRLPLRGNDAVLLLDDPTGIDTAALASALSMPRVDVWAPVTITMQELRSFESLHVWLSSQPRPFGALAVDRQATLGLLDPQDRFTCPTLLTGDSFAYLAMRKTGDDTWQFGAHGFGPAAGPLTTDLVELIVAWDRGSPPAASGRVQLLVPRRDATIAITWPSPASPR